MTLSVSTGVGLVHQDKFINFLCVPGLTSPVSSLIIPSPTETHFTDQCSVITDCYSLISHLMELPKCGNSEPLFRGSIL